MPTRRFILAALPLVAGCASRIWSDSGEQARIDPDLQDKSLNPRNGGLLVGPEALHPGDIVLSAASGVSSIGVRLLSMAPVSHASLYMGGAVAEAVGEGIRRRSIERVLAEESTVVAFRHPHLRAEHLPAMEAFVAQNLGKRYNFVGVVLQAPFSIERRLCELPLTPAMLRDFCVQGVGAVQLGAGPSNQFFCSQFVLEAYKRAGLPLTDADPRLLSPADLMHMREGDVPSVRTHQALQYVGHLKYQPASQRPA